MGLRFDARVCDNQRGLPFIGKEESKMAEKNMQEILQKAEVLIEALPYIQRFNRKIIVVKYGGSAMVDDELKMDVIKDVTLLKRRQGNQQMGWKSRHGTGVCQRAA